MRSFAFRTLLLSLLTTASGKKQEHKGIYAHKCCAEYEMLSSDGRSCVEADWPRNVSFQRDKFENLVRPLDEAWLQRWVPPGLPHQEIKAVLAGYKHVPIYFFEESVRVDSSSVWNGTFSLREDEWRKQVVFFGKVHIARPKPGGGKRSAHYCVDAAAPPLGPFALVLGTECTHEECITKCCSNGQVMVKKKGKWECEDNSQGYWSPFNSSFAKAIDAEFPVRISLSCDTFFRLASPQDSSARWARSEYRQLVFSTWQPCFDYHRGKSSLEEGLFYCESRRIQRGIYRIIQPMCVLSACLLAVALLSIACDRGMRRKEHGWCLACHAFCLFGFNVGQIGYYVALSSTLDATLFDNIPVHLQRICKPLALSMYFLLTASWFWLTALCVNMSLGFRLQAAPPHRRTRKKFLVFSAIAWGVPVVLTIICSVRFTHSYELYSRSNISWSYPSLVETRTCYIEPYGNGPYDSSIASYKDGTTIFYFLPVMCVVLCNLGCLAVTIRKVQRLRRGNSVLRREEDAGRRRANGVDATADVSTGNGRNDGFSRAAVDAKKIKMYLKMLLMTGVIELVSDVVIWGTSNFTNEVGFENRDYHYPYRTSGHITDFFRAACVTWLAAPEAGYMRLFRGRLRGEKK